MNSVVCSVLPDSSPSSWAARRKSELQVNPFRPGEDQAAAGQHSVEELLQHLDAAVRGAETPTMGMFSVLRERPFTIQGTGPQLSVTNQAEAWPFPGSYLWPFSLRKLAYALQSSLRLLRYEKLATTVTNGLRHRHRLPHILLMMLRAE